MGNIYIAHSGETTLNYIFRNYSVFRGDYLKLLFRDSAIYEELTHSVENN